MHSNLHVYDKKHIIRKFEKYLTLIQTQRVVSFQPAKNELFCRNATASHKLPSTLDYEWECVDTSNGFNFNKTQYQWFAFQGDLTQPENFDPTQHFLHFDFVIDRKFTVRPWDDEFPAGPEGRFWINGKPIAAIDEFHHGAMITELGHVELRIFTARCESNHFLSRFGVSCVHKDTESLYQRIRFLISVIKELDEDNVDKPNLIRIIDETVRKLDIRDLSDPIPLKDIRRHDKDRVAFYNSVPSALAYLKSSLSSLPKTTELDPSVSVIGYSHIDTCWEWPYSLSHFKSANTAISMIHLMEHPPIDCDNVQWHFLATSAQHYKWLKKDSPEIYAKVVEKIKEGRWEPNGVMWVESDINNPNGESLIRQLIMGIRFFKKEFDIKQTVLFLPDCFGFSASLPQILRKAGIECFVTSKISWCEYTKFPHSTFIWRGIDGSDVTAHFITTPSSWSYQTSTYTGVSNAYELIGTYKQYKQKDILKDSALHTSGNGDGGGGITEEMVWNLNLMNELPKINNVPKLVFPTLTELFEEILQKKNQLPIWDDELYLEYHRGTYTTQEEVKRINRELEASLHNAEWFIVILSSLYKLDFSDVLTELENIWEKTLLFQFHDAVPGSSINEANQEILKKGEKCLQKIKTIIQTLANKLSSYIPSKDDDTIIFNTLSHERSVCEQKVKSCGWTIKSPNTIIKIDDIETTTYEKTLEDNYNVHTHNHQFIESTIPPHNNPEIIINSKKKTVTTPFLNIIFDENGLITSIIDRKTERQYLSSPANLFELYEDRPINWPAWDIQLYHKEMQIDSPIFDGYEFNDDKVILRYHISKPGNGSAEITTIEQIITFSSTGPYIDFKTIVNWTQHDKLLKVTFPTTIRSRYAKFGIQFGNIQRPTHSNTKRDMAKFETYGRWAELSDSSSGVYICSDVKCGYDVHENIMRLSLLKAPMQTDKWADFGKRKFNYRVCFGQNINIVHLSNEINNPIVISKDVKKDEIKQTLSVDASFVEVNDDNVIIETLKPSYANPKDCFIVRMYEASGSWRKCEVKFPLLKANEWDIYEVDLLEEKIDGTKQIKTSKGGFASFEVEMNAFELKSIAMYRKSKLEL
ncbi:glycosyl hydrolase [Histomonas meleagridis]|uniref:glycosyl hydrolase n=1 Tax=Histomonas meleagridis TaxID=135588 RepID=UPI00355A40E6|nr:glycosyl hydrolase [Histomonas meleagridis]KAH0796102.1 glycosyl hydrolase [Histomonas meleagridis]